MPTPTNKQIGKRGEEVAVRFLISRGYAILKRNYRTVHGEIDCVAQKDGAVVFVEVKTRRSRQYGTALEAVTLKQQTRICLSAALFLQESGLMNSPCRFDVLTVEARGGRALCRHLQNAFDCSDAGL